MSWLELGYVLSQLFTGHDHFQDKLYRISLCGDWSCMCGEARDYVLWYFNLYSADCAVLLASKDGPIIGPIHHGVLVSIIGKQLLFAALHRLGMARGRSWIE